MLKSVCPRGTLCNGLYRKAPPFSCFRYVKGWGHLLFERTGFVIYPLDLFLAKPRAARFIISSRAKRACITRAWQGQRDLLLAIGWCPPLRNPGSDVKVHYGFPGNRLPLWQCWRSLYHHPISQANKREQQTQQQWIQQVAGNPRWERITNKTPQDRERRL